MILGLMSSGCFLEFARLGCQGKVRPMAILDSIESELLAAFVAIDVPAAFCAPEVFVDAAVIAFHSGGLVPRFQPSKMLRCSFFSEV